MILQTALRKILFYKNWNSFSHYRSILTLSCTNSANRSLLVAASSFSSCAEFSKGEFSLWRPLLLSCRNFSAEGRLESTKTQKQEGRVSSWFRQRFRKSSVQSHKLQRSALFLYLMAMRQIDHDLFMTELELPDTFNSWFKITELHVWMLLLRLAQEGESGKIMSKALVETMWQDAEERVKKIGYVPYRTKKDSFKILYGQFKAAMFMYDEGIMGSDAELANSLWVGLFNKKCEDPQKLEIVVEYVRKQVNYLSINTSKQIIIDGLVVLAPLYRDEPDPAKIASHVKHLREHVEGAFQGVERTPDFKMLSGFLKPKKDTDKGKV